MPSDKKKKRHHQKNTHRIQKKSKRNSQLSKVQEYARKIDRLQRNLQRQGIKPSQSRRFKELTRKLSEFIKNEVRRIINRIVKLYNPEVIVIENLKSLYKKFLSEYPKAVKKVVARYGYGGAKEEVKRS